MTYIILVIVAFFDILALYSKILKDKLPKLENRAGRIIT